MKKLALLLTLFLSIGIFSQDTEYTIKLINPVKKACKAGEYSKLEKLFVKKYNYKKYILNGYEIFKSDYLEDYNYVFTNISTNKDYYKTVHYAVTELLNPIRKVNYEVYDKFTAMSQVDENDNYHIVFIFGDSPQH